LKKFLICILIFCISVSSFISGSLPVHADSSVGNVFSFDDLENEGKYLGDKYRDNYSLDLQSSGLVSGLINDLANIMFEGIKQNVVIVTAFFYHAMTFNITALFSSQIEGIQSALKTHVFDAFFILAMAFAMFVLVKKISKRDLSGFLVEIGKILLIVVLTTLVVKYSAPVLTATTQISKDIGIDTMMTINGEQGAASGTFAINAASLVWKSLIHEPWKMLQFGNTNPSDDEVEEFLSTKPGTPERQEVVDRYVTNHRHEDETVMSSSAGTKRAGFLLTYSLPLFVKSIVYLILAAALLAFQVLAVFFVLLAAFILIVSLLPGYGIEFISQWLRKILETQFMIIITSGLLGMIIAFDTFVFARSSRIGWLMVIVMEAVISIILIFNLKRILRITSKVSNVVSHPTKFKKDFRRSGNVLGAMANKGDQVSNQTKGLATMAISAKSSAVFLAGAIGGRNGAMLASRLSDDESGGQASYNGNKAQKQAHESGDADFSDKEANENGTDQEEVKVKEKPMNRPVTTNSQPIPKKTKKAVKEIPFKNWNDDSRPRTDKLSG